jgi:large-conductance mechanosensitive channel
MIFNLFVGGIIGLIYYLIICQISNNMFLENKNIYSMQNSIMFLYFGGIIGLFLGSNMFSKDNKLENSSMKIGLYFGSAMLLFNSMITNWDKMSSQTKLLLLGINFGLIVWFSYYKIKSNNKKEKNNKEKKDKRKKSKKNKKEITTTESSDTTSSSSKE